MGVPIKYRKRGENLISSYDFFDILSGTAYQTMYGGKIAVAAGTGILRSFVFDSFTNFPSNYGVYTDVERVSGSAEKKVDIDFDVDVEKSITIKGEMLANGTCSFYDGGDTVDFSFYCIVKLRRVIGAAEEEIASGQSATITGSTLAQSTLHEFRWGANVDVPKTTFKKGEILRITVEMWPGGVSSASTSTTFCHDPNNKKVTNKVAADSTLKFFVPFEVVL